VFLVLGGEGPLSSAYVEGAFSVNAYAEASKALVVAIEHRFYGDSMPINSSSVKALKYLSSRQALADAANFRFHSGLGGASSEWIAFGGSYSGALAAWARLKFPEAFAGAVATSAPVIARADYPQYFDVASASLGTACSGRVRWGTEELDRMLSTAGGRKELATIFDACDPIDSDLDAATFLSSLSDPIAETVQYNRGPDIAGVCTRLFSNPDALASWANLVKGQCVASSYTKMVGELANTSAGRSWTWQTCTEFGYYQTGQDATQPFSSRINLAWFERICTDVFGVTPEEISNSVDQTNKYYGAASFAGNATVFNNGDVDPWHVLSVLTPKPGQYEAHLIHGTAHCADLYAASSFDSQELRDARKATLAAIATWLKE